MVIAHTARYMRRLLQLSQDDRNGAGVATADFLEALLHHAELAASYIFTDVHSNGNVDGQFRGAYSELVERFGEKAPMLASVRDLNDLLKRHPRFIAYTSGVFLSSLTGVRPSCSRHFPVCSLSHSLDVSVPFIFMPGALLYCRPYDTVITSSLAGKKALEEMINISSDLLGSAGRVISLKPRIEVIPLGINCDQFASSNLRPMGREILGIADTDLTILYLGRLSRETKADLEPLLISLRERCKTHAKVTLVIAGRDSDGNYLLELNNLIKVYGISKYVRLFLNFPPYVKPMLYAASDIFVAPADNTQETFGLAIIEAMAAGLPVVASDWSGYRELVAHGVSGYLVPTFWSSNSAQAVSALECSLSESVRRAAMAQNTAIDVSSLDNYLSILINNNDLRKSMGDAGRAIARNKYDWRHIVPLHTALWNELLIQSEYEACDPGGTRPYQYMDAFKHYATSELNESVRLQWSELRTTEEFLDAQVRNGPLTVRHADANKLVKILRLNPVGLAELQSLGLEESGIAWMIKKGFLTCKILR